MGVPERKHWRPEKLVPAAYNSLINLDEPLHREMRMQQSEFFFPGYLDTIRERVGLKIDALLDDMEKQGPVVDFVKLFSEELPLFTLCEMLGIDEQDRPKVKVWMHHLEMGRAIFNQPLADVFLRADVPVSFQRDRKQPVQLWRSGDERSPRESPQRSFKRHRAVQIGRRTATPTVSRWFLAADYLCGQ